MANGLTGSPQAQPQGKLQKQMTGKIVRKPRTEAQSPSRSEKLAPSQLPSAVWMLHIPNWMLGVVLSPGQGSAPCPQPAVRHSWSALLLTPSRMTSCCLTAARASSELPISSEEVCHFLVNAVCGCCWFCSLLQWNGCPGGTGTVPTSQQLFNYLRRMAVLVQVSSQSAVSQ